MSDDTPTPDFPEPTPRPEEGTPQYLSFTPVGNTGDPGPEPAGWADESSDEDGLSSLSPSLSPEEPARSEYPDDDPRFDGIDGDGAAPGERSERRGIGTLIVVALLAGLIGAALSGAVVFWLTREDGAGTVAPTVTVVERIQTEIISPTEPSTTASAVARRVLPSIVTVEISESATDFDATGSGSGVVLDSDGLLVTNQHVVDGAAALRVVFADGRTYDAELVGGDTLTDIALIRIAATGLTPVELGSTEELEIGDTAIAIGSPLGLGGGPSVTVGVVSAFERRVRTAIDSELFGMLQTDAPITRGSSGGALVDSRGRLIGITTAIGVSDVGAEGLGFAIPVELVTRITSDLLADGQVSHAFLGITGTTYVDQESDGATVPSGVVVEGTIDDTAAAAAGIRAGDIIRSFDGESVVTMEQLVVELRFYRVGDVVDLLVTRDGVDETIQLTLMERPEGV